MLQAIIEGIIEVGFRTLGWGVLKLITLGRYRGFEANDLAREGAVGLATVLAVGYGLYRWIW